MMWNSKPRCSLSPTESLRQWHKSCIHIVICVFIELLSSVRCARTGSGVCFTPLSSHTDNQNEAVLVSNANALPEWKCPPTHVQNMIRVRPQRCSDLGSFSCFYFRFRFYVLVCFLLDQYGNDALSQLHPTPQKATPKGATTAAAACQLLQLCCLLAVISRCVSALPLIRQQLQSSAAGCSGASLLVMLETPALGEAVARWIWGEVE